MLLCVSLEKITKKSMRKTKLWSIRKNGDQTYEAHAVDATDSTETEAMLEDLLVASSDLLGERLTIVGRQIPTSGGPLDLLGVDEDGYLVVFELKRGTVTRDAVAQVLDYASDLVHRDAESLARLIEDNSGRGGIDPIENFLDWYDDRFPNGREPLERAPKMVLVGLGVDERARRIVQFLSGSGTEIELVTFNAFKQEGHLFLAREVEISTLAVRPQRSGGDSKEQRQRILLETAESLEVKELLEEVGRFIADRVPTAHKSPVKTAYSFSLAETTDEGNESLRAYVAAYLNPKKRGTLLLRLTPRAVEAAGDATQAFRASVSGATNPKHSSFALEAPVSEQTWPEISQSLEPLLAAWSTGGKSKRIA